MALVRDIMKKKRDEMIDRLKKEREEMIAKEKAEAAEMAEVLSITDGECDNG